MLLLRKKNHMLRRGRRGNAEHTRNRRNHINVHALQSLCRDCCFLRKTANEVLLCHPSQSVHIQQLRTHTHSASDTIFAQIFNTSVTNILHKSVSRRRHSPATNTQLVSHQSAVFPPLLLMTATCHGTEFQN